MSPIEIDNKLRESLQTKIRVAPEEYQFFQLDSLAVVNLILELEGQFDIVVDITDLQEEKVGNYENLVNFIKEKTGVQ